MSGRPSIARFALWCLLPALLVLAWLGASRLPDHVESRAVRYVKHDPLALHRHLTDWSRWQVWFPTGGGLAVHVPGSDDPTLVWPIETREERLVVRSSSARSGLRYERSSGAREGVLDPIRGAVMWQLVGDRLEVQWIERRALDGNAWTRAMSLARAGVWDEALEETIDGWLEAAGAELVDAPAF